MLPRSARGKNLIDVDDNKYTDYWMGHWSLILGHAAPKVAEKVRKQICQIKNDRFLSYTSYNFRMKN